ncbi:MAG: Rpn family recombination-promoting nuclease/putative transposase, partial [Cocleimonas sp.]|nr:Rpn family recombination-promoting nuclease/putative transposase [Cocleimonas sp.]
MSRKLISFDWAMKRLLRSKANFSVLEGFLSELLKDDITIEEVLESESNQETQMDKFNRVDLKVKNSAQEVIVIEIQYDSELDYFQRILYASSKAITEHMRMGESYQHVIKVISINILYFNLGEGDDYIYRGTTRFKGLHERDELHLTSGQRKLFSKAEPHDIFPEYYLIRVNKFDDIAKDSLDEWIYFLKNEEIKESFSAKGLKQAKEALDVMKLSEQERIAYEKYLDDKSYKASMYQSTYVTGHLRGKEEGREEG